MYKISFDIITVNHMLRGQVVECFILVTIFYTYQTTSPIDIIGMIRNKNFEISSTCLQKRLKNIEH